MATTDIYTVMGGLYPLKQGCRFLGGDVNDQIQINAAGAAMANVSYYGTLAAWINVPDDTGTYAVISFGDDNVVEHITLRVAAGKIEAECNDNTTVQWKYVSTNQTIKPHTWHHVAVTQDGKYPKLYVDGEEVTTTRTTDTTPVSWFKACAGIDAGSIGAAEMTGDTALTQEFKGYISQVKVWASASTATNVALTADQLKIIMSGGTVGTAHNSWDLDGDANDDGSGADNGTIVGDIIYCTGNEFASRFTFGAGTALVADKVLVGMNNTHGLGYVIQAA
jgi:hypothetical protein